MPRPDLRRLARFLAVPSGPPGESRVRRNAAVALLAVAHLCVFPYFERVQNPNENSRVWMARAIVEHGELNVATVQKEWGYVNDKAVGREKRPYSGKAPGTSLLGVPFLWAQTRVSHLLAGGSPSKISTTLGLRTFSVALPMCLFYFFFARWIERRTRSAAARDLLTVGLGLGTLMYPYGITFVGHAQGAALGFASFMLLAPGPGAAADARSVRRRLFAAGLLAGLSVTFEYQNVLVVALLALYAFAVYRLKTAVFLLGGLGPAALLAGYHAIVFGSPTEMPYAHLDNPLFAKLHHSSGFLGLGKPRAAAYKHAMFTTSYGLFVFSPFLAAGIVGALKQLVAPGEGGRRLDGAVVLAVGAAMFLFLAGMTNWRAGWCVGPRYIAIVAPFLAAGAADLWRVRWPRVVAGVSAFVAGLVIGSVFMCGIAGSHFPHYPEWFNNPVFDLSIPLLGEGYVPYSVGGAIGLPGLWSLLPLGAAAFLGIALGLGGDGRGWRRWLPHAIAGVLVAGAFLTLVSRAGRRPEIEEQNAARFVRSIWEPAHAAIQVRFEGKPPAMP